MVDQPLYDDAWEDDVALPPRPRRRWVTPMGIGLAAVLIAAVGFIGGVEVQKSQQSSGSSGGGAASAGAAPSAGAAASRGGFARAGGSSSQGTPTAGSVANKHGSTLYVKDANGTTVRVKTTSHSKINRTDSATAGAIHPGDTVIVQGTKSAGGTITATRITATSSAATSGGGLGALFGGGGFGPSAPSAPRGAAPGGG